MPAPSPAPAGSRRPRGETSEARIAKALAHPLRTYHVRMLRGYDCIELDRTEPVRGALQHFYKAIVRPNLDDAPWRTPPENLRANVLGETVQAVVADLAAAADAGLLDDPDVVLIRTPLELDAKGVKKLNALLTKTRERALAIAAESAERDRRPGLATELATVHFKRGG